MSIDHPICVANFFSFCLPEKNVVLRLPRSLLGPLYPNNLMMNHRSNWIQCWIMWLLFYTIRNISHSLRVMRAKSTVVNCKGEKTIMPNKWKPCSVSLSRNCHCFSLVPRSHSGWFVYFRCVCVSVCILAEHFNIHCCFNYVSIRLLVRCSLLFVLISAAILFLLLLLFSGRVYELCFLLRQNTHSTRHSILFRCPQTIFIVTGSLCCPAALTHNHLWDTLGRLTEWKCFQFYARAETFLCYLMYVYRCFIHTYSNWFPFLQSALLYVHAMFVFVCVRERARGFCLIFLHFNGFVCSYIYNASSRGLLEWTLLWNTWATVFFLRVFSVYLPLLCLSLFRSSILFSSLPSPSFSLSLSPLLQFSTRLSTSTAPSTPYPPSVSPSSSNQPFRYWINSICNDDRYWCHIKLSLQ